MNHALQSASTILILGLFVAPAFSGVIQRYEYTGEEVNFQWGGTATGHVEFDSDDMTDGIVSAGEILDFTIDLDGVLVADITFDLTDTVLINEFTLSGTSPGATIVAHDVDIVDSVQTNRILQDHAPFADYLILPHEAPFLSGEWTLVAVPEPSTVTLAALGLLGLLACGRRRRR